MQKIIQSQTHSKTQDMQRDYYLNKKKTLEINPKHPLIKELLRRVEDNPADKSASDMAVMMYNTATLRSDYSLKDTVTFEQQIEAMMKQNLGVEVDEMLDEEEKVTDEVPATNDGGDSLL
jgi:heat shock protein beta